MKGEEKIMSIMDSYARFLDAIGSGVDLTEQELQSLIWLADCDWRTVDNLVSIFGKVRACRDGGAQDE